MLWRCVILTISLAAGAAGQQAVASGTLLKDETDFLNDAQMRSSEFVLEIQLLGTSFRDDVMSNIVSRLNLLNKLFAGGAPVFVSHFKELALNNFVLTDPTGPCVSGQLCLCFGQTYCYQRLTITFPANPLFELAGGTVEKVALSRVPRQCLMWPQDITTFNSQTYVDVYARTVVYSGTLYDREYILDADMRAGSDLTVNVELRGERWSQEIATITNETEWRNSSQLLLLLSTALSSSRNSTEYPSGMAALRASHTELEVQSNQRLSFTLLGIPQYSLPAVSGAEIVSAGAMPADILEDAGRDPSDMPVLTHESVTLLVRSLEFIEADPNEKSLYGEQLRNEMLLKPLTDPTVLALKLHNIKWAEDIATSSVQKSLLIRHLINSSSSATHGLNAMREQYLSDFTVTRQSDYLVKIRLPTMLDYNLPPMEHEGIEGVRLPASCLESGELEDILSFAGFTSRTIHIRTITIDALPAPTVDCHPSEPWQSSIPTADCAQELFTTNASLSENELQSAYFAVFRLQFTLHCPVEDPCSWAHLSDLQSESVRAALGDGVFRTPRDLQESSWLDKRADVLYQGFDDPAIRASALRFSESLVRTSNTTLLLILPHLPDYNLVKGTTETVRFGAIAAEALESGRQIESHIGSNTLKVWAASAFYSGNFFFPIVDAAGAEAAMDYEYIPDSQNALSFIAVSELTTSFERVVDISLIGSKFAADVASNVNKSRAVVLSILGASVPSDVYSQGFVTMAYNGAFDNSLVRLSDTAIRLIITEQVSLQLPAQSTERITCDSLPWEALEAPGQIERSGQIAVDIRSPTVRISGDFYSDLPSPSAYFSGDAFTDYSIRSSVYKVQVQLHGATWNTGTGSDGQPLHYNCGLMEAVFKSTEDDISGSFKHAMTASFALSTAKNRLFKVDRVLSDLVIITVQLPDYQLPPASFETISVADVPAACVSSPLSVHHKQLWKNATSSWVTTQHISEVVVARTAHFSGTFFGRFGVGLDYQLRGTEVYEITISLAYEKWATDVTTNGTSFQALLKSVFATNRRVGFPDFFVNGFEAAYEQGYLGTANLLEVADSTNRTNSSSNSTNSTNSSSNSTNSSPDAAESMNSTVSAADYVTLFYQNSSTNTTLNSSASGVRISDSELTIYLRQLSSYSLPPFGSEQIKSAGIPAQCVQAADSVLLQTGSISTTISQRTVSVAGTLYDQGTRTALGIHHGGAAASDDSANSSNSSNNATESESNNSNSSNGSNSSITSNTSTSSSAPTMAEESTPAYNVVLLLTHDTWSTACCNNSAAQQQLMAAVFSSDGGDTGNTTDMPYSLDKWFNTAPFSVQCDTPTSLTVHVPVIAGYTPLPSSAERLTVTTVPASCFASGFDISAVSGSDCDRKSPHTCTSPVSTKIYSKPVAIFSGDFFSTNTERPDYLQPSPSDVRASNLPFEVEIELIDASWATDISHSFLKQIDVIAMVLRSDKRKQLLEQGWERLTWPLLGVREGRGVALGFNLVDSNTLKISVPRIVNYRLPLGVSETISAGVISTSVLSAPENGVAEPVAYLEGDTFLHLKHANAVHQNMAFRRPTVQSSDTAELPVGYSYYAVDNSAPMDYYSGGCSKTRFESHPLPWWRVELARETAVRMVAFVTPQQQPTQLIEVRVGSQRVRPSVQARAHPVCGTRTTDPAEWQEIPCHGKVGRYVSIRSLEPGALSLSEVRVYGAGDLVSEGRPASQSSSSSQSAEIVQPSYAANSMYAASLEAELATDGQVLGHGSPGKCALTSAELEPWWSVALDFPYRVQSVLIWLGEEEGDAPDASISVHVGDSLDNHGSLNPVCGTLLRGFEKNVSNSSSPCTSRYCPVVEVLCDTELVGRHVTLVLSTGNSSETRALSLCEVQVFGAECDARCQADFQIAQDVNAAATAATFNTAGYVDKKKFCQTKVGVESCHEWDPPGSTQSHVSTWGVDF